MSMRQLKITKSITNRESQSLEKYLQEIARLELVTPEEEITLGHLIKQGDQKSVDRLIKANLRFVVSVSKQYQNQGMSLSDLINEGNVGLIKAAQRFDETRGFKFISYGVWWIRQSILQALAREGRLVRLPINRVGLTQRIHKAFSQLEQTHEREPSVDELAELLNIDHQEISFLMASNSRHASIDTPVGEAEGTLLDVLENVNSDRMDEKLDHDQSMSTEIQRSLQTLTERQKDVLCQFFGIGMDHPLSLEDIGEKYCITRERVRQIKDKAILRLRERPKGGLLREYLGV